MAKRILPLLLLLVLLLPLLTGAVQAIGTAVDLEPYVREQYELLAQSMDRVGADETALWAMVNHALYGRGRDLAFGNNNAMTAVMLNSEMYKETVIEALTAAIERMQTFGLDEMILKGNAGWYDYQLRHYLTDYGSDGLAHDGILHESNFTGTLNDNDVAMILVVGSASSRIGLKKVSVTEERVTYDVNFYLADGFDFDNTYEDMEDLGYDVTLAEALTQVGKLLAIGLIDEYQWYVDATFRITVPNTCDHHGANYSWIFDGEELVSVTDGSFAHNGAEFVAIEEDGVVSPTSKADRVFELDQTVQLLHDQPWVLEFTARGDSTMLFSPTVGKDSRYPFLYKIMVEDMGFDDWYEYRHYMFGGTYTDGSNPQTAWEYNGKKFSNSYSGSQKTYRLENRVAEDGSNLIDLSVNGVYKGTLSEYYTSRRHGQYRYRYDDPSWITGRDFFINYIGQEETTLKKLFQSVSVWENGRDSAADQIAFSHLVEPTCTEQGYTVHACTTCGAEFTSEFVEPTGHRFDHAISVDLNDAAARTACVVCGEAGEEQDLELAVRTAEDGSVTFRTAYAEDGESKFTAINREAGVLDVTIPEREDLLILAASYDENGRMLAARRIEPENTPVLPLKNGEIRVFFLSAENHAPALPLLTVQPTTE